MKHEIEDLKKQKQQIENDLDTKLQKKADKLQASIDQKETERQVNLDQLRNLFNENNLNNLQQDPEEKQGGCTIRIVTVKKSFIKLSF